MCAHVRIDLNALLFFFFLERGLELLLRQESLITPLPVPERAGAGLSGVNEMNFSHLCVGGLAAAFGDVCVFCVKDFH